MRTLCLSLSLVVTLMPMDLIAAGEFWTRSSGPQGGSVYALTSTKGGIVFAGSNQGVYESADNGNTWKPAGPADIEVACLLVSSDSKLYVGTQYQGVYKCDLANHTWIKLETGIPNGQVKAIVEDRTGGICVGLLGEGFYRSTDAGNSWERRTAGMSNTNVMALAALPTGSLLAGTNGGGVFRSTDDGLSWISAIFPDTLVYSFAVDSSGTLLAGCYGNQYRSVDDGMHWTLFAMLVPPNACLAMLFNHDGYILIGVNGGIFRSTDHGTTWEAPDLSGAHVMCLLESPTSTLMAGVSGQGVYASTDAGISWDHRVDGITSTRVTSIVAQPSGVLFAGTWGDGIYSSHDHGETWEYAGLRNQYVSAMAVHPTGYLLAGSFGGGVFVSFDRGTTWEQCSALPGNTHIFSFACDSSGRIFAGGYQPGGPAGIFVSSDSGRSWDLKSSGIPLNPTVSALAVDAQGTLYSSESSPPSNFGTFRSTDGGNSWISIINGLPQYNYQANCFAIDQSGRLLAGITNRGVYYSTDRGDSWNPLNTAFPEYLMIRAIAFNSRREIYAGSEGSGVYKYSEGTHAWVEINEGLTNRNVRSIAIDRDDYLVAGTFGAGVYRSAQPIVSIGEAKGILPMTIALRQNYPNPLNPTTTIGYALSQRSHVTLTVFNMLGQRVAELVNSDIDAGSHEVQFNASGLASGFYFYRLTAGGFVQTRKLCLIR